MLVILMILGLMILRLMILGMILGERYGADEACAQRGDG
jgi:hypothetical protein